MKTNFSKFEESIGVSFKNKLLLKEALTHRSYLNENPSWDVPHNERFEYLGDAVLELIVSEYLFKKFPERPEGELTSLRAALVNYQMLSKVARDVGFEGWIFLSRGEGKDTGRARDVILANAMEALLGAIYIDLGYKSTYEFVERFILPHLDKIISEKLYVDPKSYLQEIAQEKMKVTPTYEVLKEQGPAHQKRFSVGVFFGETLIAQGEGASKQEAESSAASVALKNFKKKEEDK